MLIKDHETIIFKTEEFNRLKNDCDSLYQEYMDCKRGYQDKLEKLQAEMDKLKKDTEVDKFGKMNIIETDYKKKLDAMKHNLTERDEKIMHLNQDNKLLLSQLQATERNLEDLRIAKKEIE
jgi:hypothetical protein